MLEDYEKILYKFAYKAYKRGEVPVAALIVYKNKVIAKAYNKRINSSNPLLHAEVCVITKASRKIGDWRLSDCDLYVTLEPCHMCKEIIREARIKNVYYFVENEKYINFKTNFKKIESSSNNNYKELLTNFFKKLR